MKHYLTELDLTVEETLLVLAEAARWKEERRAGIRRDFLRGRHVALYFEKPSVRTRISFTVAVNEMGGHVVELSGSNTKVDKGEDPRDFAKVVGRYTSMLVARVFEQQKLAAMASFAGVPVVNALSNERHPCQALADVLTMIERRGAIENLKIAFIGEGNNVVTSTGLLAAALGAHVEVASPIKYGLQPQILEMAKSMRGRLLQIEDVEQAASGADVLYTDTWVSMGQEEEAKARRKDLAGYQINAALVEMASPGAIVMHCLPAVRDEEITTEVMYAPASALWDQAENRLHAQKALMAHLLSA